MFYFRPNHKLSSRCVSLQIFISHTTTSFARSCSVWESLLEEPVVKNDIWSPHGWSRYADAGHAAVFTCVPRQLIITPRLRVIITIATPASAATSAHGGHLGRHLEFLRMLKGDQRSLGGFWKWATYRLPKTVEKQKLFQKFSGSTPFLPHYNSSNRIRRKKVIFAKQIQ